MDISHLLGTKLQEAGFTLREIDDDLVELSYRGDTVARYSQHGVQFSRVIRDAKATLSSADNNCNSIDRFG